MVFRTKEKKETLDLDPVHRLVVACHIGGSGKKAARKFWLKIPLTLRSCYFETDD